jgi:CspA family cold shock protein
MNKATDSEIGELKVYDQIKGYGFIKRAKGKDVFAFFSDFISPTSEAGAVPGSIVEFSVETTPRGLRAKNIKVIT